MTWTVVLTRSSREWDHAVVEFEERTNSIACRHETRADARFWKLRYRAPYSIPLLHLTQIGIDGGKSLGEAAISISRTLFIESAALCL